MLEREILQVLASFSITGRQVCATGEEALYPLWLRSSHSRLNTSDDISGMQVITSDRLTLADIEFGTAGPEDAPAVMRLYDAVYRGQYPCPELFTVEGMAAYLDYARSHAITILFTHKTDLIGSLSCQLQGRAAYVRGVMVAPEWQGRVHAKVAISGVLLHWREVLEGEVDYFYSEARTETPKFQVIVEAIG